jgi:hypothetical protein
MDEYRLMMVIVDLVIRLRFREKNWVKLGERL